MEDWFTIKVHDINDNAQLNSYLSLRVNLNRPGALPFIWHWWQYFCEVFNSPLFDLVTRSLQDSNETSYGWVTESAM